MSVCRVRLRVPARGGRTAHEPLAPPLAPCVAVCFEGAARQEPRKLRRSARRPSFSFTRQTFAQSRSRPGPEPGAGGTEAKGAPSLSLSCSQTGSGDKEPWALRQRLAQVDAWARRAEEGRGLGEGSGLASEGALNSREGEWKGGGELSRRGNGVSGYAAAWHVPRGPGCPVRPGHRKG